MNLKRTEWAKEIAILTAERDAARAEASRARRMAIEEAAKVAERAGGPVGAGDGWGTYIPGTSADAADAIRALLSDEKDEPI